MHRKLTQLLDFEQLHYKEEFKKQLLKKKKNKKEKKQDINN